LGLSLCDRDYLSTLGRYYIIQCWLGHTGGSGFTLFVWFLSSLIYDMCSRSLSVYDEGRLIEWSMESHEYIEPFCWEHMLIFALTLSF
jgi:hypothetical protein